MTNKEYIKHCLRTSTGLKVSVGTHNQDLLHAVIGIGTEAGELQDQVKKHLFYGRPLDVLNIKEELGDLLWYVSMLLYHIGSDYETIMEANIEKLKVRYPEKFSEDSAVNRNLEQERKALCQKK